MESTKPELELSGPAWVARFPTSRSTASLVEPFQSYVERFITALEREDCTVRISATRRPEARAWLMRWAWDVSRGLVAPELVPARSGIPIQWDHGFRAASVVAAAAMVKDYGLVHRPSLTSRHIEGRAIDMDISCPWPLEVVDGSGRRLWVRNSADLYEVGASYNVHKLVSDPPHWSDDGR